MSSGMIPLEDFEYAIAHLSMLPDRVEHVKNVGRQPLEEVGQTHSGVLFQEEKNKKAPKALLDKVENTCNGPMLPLEIVSMVGMILFNESHLSRPAWLVTLLSPSYEEGNNQASAHHSFKALLNLSTACKSFRSVLASLVWHSVHFHHPRHFGEFVHLMKRYKSISSPLTAISGAAPTSSEVSHEWTQEYPLRLVKEMYLVMPQRYPGFDQSLLVGLLRDGMRSSLQHVIWEAEELPAASTLKAMAGEDFFSPSKYAIHHEEQEKHSFGLASEIGEEDIVRWTRSSRDGEAFPCRGQLLPPNKTSHRDKVKEEEIVEEGLTSLSVNCKCFWPGHSVLSKFQGLRHLHLTYYDLFLLPPHLPTLLEHLRQPLLSLSMSTSKTSLLHSIPLINLGCFDHLQVLDLYPVTPEYPLPQAIRRCRKTLRVLRLVMDISAHFTNFDNLWKILGGQEEASCSDNDDLDLQGSMEALEILHIDPMPQQNTAPSFASFVEACPRLTWVNGRRRDSFAPGMEPLDPDHITSALYY